jgi:hypothetical protein
MVEMVRHFFEGDFRSVAAEVCEPEMGAAVEAYLLERYYRQRDFAELDFGRLAACSKLGESDALKEILFRGLDLWAENRFDLDTQIGTAMEAYISRVRENLEDRLSPGRYVGTSGLRHVELLKQYLNEAFRRDGVSDLWREYFPRVFSDVDRRQPFAVVFLLMMLDRGQQTVEPDTRPDEEVLSMLVRCGYEYICEGTFNDLATLPFDILRAVADAAIEEEFYLREDHKEGFPRFVDRLLVHGVAVDTIALLSDGRRALRNIIVERIKFIVVPRPHITSGERSYLLDLIEFIPADAVAGFEDEWREILAEAKKSKDLPD